MSGVAGQLWGPVMFRTLGPSEAAELARFMRANTGGPDSNWLHLMVFGDPGYFVALAKRHRDEQDRARRG